MEEQKYTEKWESSHSYDNFRKGNSINYNKYKVLFPLSQVGKVYKRTLEIRLRQHQEHGAE